MTQYQVMVIARRIGRLRNQEGIDPKTFQILVSELEEAIRTVSTVLDSPTNLFDFREHINGNQSNTERNK